MRELFRTSVSFIKFMLSDKKSVVQLVLLLFLSVIWLYTFCISFSVLSLFTNPLAMYVGYRIATYGAFGLLPGGKWLHEHHYGALKYHCKDWYGWLEFCKENFFTFKYLHISKEFDGVMREITGPLVCLFGFGSRKHIFVLGYTLEELELYENPYEETKHEE